jgi:hypothetical protein
MRSATAALLLAFFLSYPIPLLAQCQAGAIQPPGVCNNSPGSQTATYYGITTTLSNTGNLQSTAQVWNAYYQRYVPRVVAFQTASGPITIATFTAHMWQATNGHYGMYLYINGSYLMTLSQDDPTSASRFNGWLATQSAANVSSWYSWAVDLYWAAKAGWASSACNASTLVALAMWSEALASILSGNVVLGLAEEGAAIAALNAEYDACLR